MGGFNPWIGFKTYEESDEKIYKGRTDDVERLYSLMTVNGCVVLYANSGIGKSSLINAGILPKLKRESEFVPVKVLFKSDMFERQPENGKAARKSESDDKDFLPDFDKWLVEAIESANFDYLISDLPDKFRNESKVEICETLEMTEDLKEKSRKNAWWYLHTHALKLIGFGMEHEFRFMLIFDQFEEIFHMTKSTRQVNAFFSFFQSLMQPQMPKDFMEALAETQCPCPEWNDKALPYNVLVSMRKDSIGELDYWCRQKLYIPSLQAIRFSLQPLDDRQCREIICGQEGIDVFSNAMADKIISAAKDESDEVSSILLSVLCQKLYRNFLEKNEVDEKLCDTPDILLREAYYEQLHGLPITRRQLKTIERSLVNDKGQRTRILLENFDSNTVKVLRELDKRFLVHITETGRNEKKVEYVEMVHDKIAEMVKGERDKTKKVKRFGGLLALLFLGVFIILSVVVKQNQIENPKMRTIEKYRDKKHDWELSINGTIGNRVLLFDMPKEINTLRLRGGTLKEKSVNISNIDTIIFDGEVTLEDGCFCGRNNVKVLKFGKYANITVKQPLVFGNLVQDPIIDSGNKNLSWQKDALYKNDSLVLKTTDEDNVRSNYKENGNLYIYEAKCDTLYIDKDVKYIINKVGNESLRIKQLKVSIRNNCYFKWKGSLYTDRYVNVPLALVLPAGDQMRIWTSFCEFEDDGHDYYIMDGSFPNPDDLPKSVYVPYGEGRKYQLYYGNDDIKELGFFKTHWYDFTLYVKCVTNFSAKTFSSDIPWFIYVLLLALLACFGVFISVHKKMNPIGSVMFVMVLFVVLVVFFYLVNYWSNDYSFTRCTMNCKTNSIIMLSMALVMGILLLVWLSKLFSYIGYEEKVSRKKMVRQVKIVYYGRLILGLYLVIIGLWLLTDPGFNEFLVGGILGIGVWLMGTDYVYEKLGNENEYEEIYRTEMIESGKVRKARLVAYYVLAVAGLVILVAYLIIEILEGQFAIWLFLLQIVACIAVTVYSIWKIRKLRKISDAGKIADTDATDEETV